mmetsp:Transcript_4295/g.6422  ORF Transcript_4295/g.6422 Transcript_4295/m.6422 type:complete len:300 (+) Transcript_4295:32-931(+)
MHAAAVVLGFLCFLNGVPTSMSRVAMTPMASKLAARAAMRRPAMRPRQTLVQAEDNDVFAVMVSFKAKEDCVEAFKKCAIADASNSVEKEEGCLRFDVVQDAADPTKFGFCEVYVNEEAFEAHKTTDHFKKFIETKPSLVYEDETVALCKNVYPRGEKSHFSSQRAQAVDDPYFSKGSLHVINMPHFIKPDCANEFTDAIIKDAEGSLSQEPGCLRFDVFQSLEDPGTFYLYEVYTNPDAFEYHKGTPHIKTWLETTENMYDLNKAGADGDVKDLQRRLRAIGANVWPPDNWSWTAHKE